MIPNFAEVDFADAATSVGKAAAAPLATPEGMALTETVYSEHDLAGLDFLNTFPGKPPISSRSLFRGMFAAQPWTVRQYAGFSTAEDFKRLLQTQSCGWTKGL